MRRIIAKFIWIMVLAGVFSLCGCVTREQPKEEHITEGEYLVNIINSDQNHYVDEENYFYIGHATLWRYSFRDGSIECYANDKGYEMKNFAVWDGDIYYVRSNDEGFELWRQNIQTGEKTRILSREDIEILNGGEELISGKSGSYCRVDAYEDYLYLTISGKHEYISPMEGDFMQECIEISTLFQEDNTSGEIQKAVYEGITFERWYDSKHERYKTIGIRDESGHKILYKGSGTGIWVNRKIVRFTKDVNTDYFQYRIGGGEFRTITCLRGKKFNWSDIEEKNLTVENSKIIGWISVSRDPNVLFNLNQNFIEREVLFELDIETGESQILYDTVNNLEKIIGYQAGIIYFAGNDTVYCRELDSKQKEVLFDLPGGHYYKTDWQAGYLIIRNDGMYEKDCDVIAAYQVSEDRLVGEEK